jgi:hypothetical protein
MLVYSASDCGGYRTKNWSADGWLNMYYLKLLRVSESSRWSRICSPYRPPINAKLAWWVMVRSLCVFIHKRILQNQWNMNHPRLFCLILTYHSRFIPKGVAEKSKIFLRDHHVIPNNLAIGNTLLVLQAGLGCPIMKLRSIFKYYHHQPINVPTVGAQAFLMGNPQGERAITTRAQCGLVDANDCKCSREQRLKVPSEERRSSRW